MPRLPHRPVYPKRGVCRILLSWLAAACLALGLQSKAVSADPEGQIHALLIGVTKYPNLRNRDLRGPANDVELLADILMQQYGVQADRIQMLVEGETDELRPTRGNIERAFQRLAELVNPGDECVILLAGHGSQQPDELQQGDESDGLDEVFLPLDTERWNGRTIETPGKVPNVITDDELSGWLTAIREKGANVVFLADACSSGTLTRGETAEYRGVTPGELGIPTELLQRSGRQSAVAAQPATFPPETLLDQSRTPRSPAQGQLVALFAARPGEITKEALIDGRFYGRFSWAIGAALSESRRNALTYRELIRQIQSSYHRYRWVDTHPTFESDSAELDREVLGRKYWPKRSSILLLKDPSGTYAIDRGELHGLSAGTLLAVYPPRAVQPAGFVRISTAGQVRSLVVPTEFEGRAAITELPAPARCEVVKLELGRYMQTVGIDTSLVSEPARRQSVTMSLQTALKIAAEMPASLFRPTTAAETPDWYIVVSESGDTARLVPASAMERSADGQLKILGIPKDRYPLDDNIDKWLMKELNDRARARNLGRLAEMSRGVESSVRLDVKVEKLNKDSNQFEPLGIENGTLRNGDRLNVLIRNNSTQAVDVTVLYIDSTPRISACIFPLDAENGRLMKGETKTISDLQIDDSTVGIEDLIILATVAGGNPDPARFDFLAEPSAIGNARSRGQTGWSSPLGVLTRGCLFGDGTRSATVADAGNFHITRISWEVVKSGGITSPSAMLPKNQMNLDQWDWESSQPFPWKGPRQKRSRRKFAVCVGINHYPEDSGFTSLQFAASDAAAIAEALLIHGDFREVLLLSDIRELSPALQKMNSSGRLKNLTSATRHMIEDELAAFCRRADRAEDLLLFYFAGHGESGRTPALLAGDHSAAAPQRISVNAVLDRLLAKEVLAQDRAILLDVCRSALNNESGHVMSEEFRKAWSLPENRITVLTGCDRNQCSLEDSELQHGRFTWALLDAFRGNGYRIGEADLLVTDLHVHVCRVFRERNWMESQTPLEFRSGASFSIAQRDVIVPERLDQFEQEDVQELLREALELYASPLVEQHLERARSKCRSAFRLLSATVSSASQDKAAAETKLIHTRVLRLWALIEYRLGNQSVADRLANEAVQWDPELPMPRLIAALRQADSGEDDKAVDELSALFKESWPMLSDEPWLWQRLERSIEALSDRLIEAGEDDRAIQLLQQLVAVQQQSQQ